MTIDGELGAMEVAKVSPVFRAWTGKAPGDSYGGKSFLDYRGRPRFAELVILWMFRDAGWDGVWVDSFRQKLWADQGELRPGGLPAFPASVLVQIRGSEGFPRGCWDVICWQGKEIIFIEAKRRSEDSIRQTQVKWLSNGITKAGLEPINFLVVEWALAEGMRTEEGAED